MHRLVLTLGMITTLLGLLFQPAIAFRMKCWTPDFSRPLIYKECYDIITKRIPHTGGFSDETPLVFSRNASPNTDIVLPMTWVLNETPECIVGVDIASTQGTSDKTTLDDVMQAAHAIAVDCVIRPPHLGGIVYEAGWQGKLNVILIAYKGGRRVVDLSGGNGTVDGVETA